MHFATHVRTCRLARLFSETALSRKPFGIGHMYIYTFSLRITDTVTSKNIDLSYWDICIYLQQVSNEDENLQINVGLMLGEVYRLY
jgi:hypothetical protein